MNTRTVIYYAAVAVLVTMHAVGLYGIVWSNNKNDYIGLTALNLCITTICFIGGMPITARTLLVFAGIALAGFIIECMGVETRAVFGNYWYGSKMGPKLLNVPLVIGLNWAVLIFSCAAMVGKTYHHIVFKSVAGATLMVLMDILIEPIAMKLGYWSWDTKQIPMQNYIAWWLISFVMLLAVFKLVKNTQNPMGKWAYGVQFLFFSLLHLFLP